MESPSRPLDDAVAQLVESEQAMMRELVRLAELNTAQALAEPVFQEAAASIRAQLRAHDAKVDALEQLGSEQDRPADVDEAMRHVGRHRKESVTLQASLRDLGGKVRAGRPRQEASERAALLLGAAASSTSCDNGAAGAGAKLSDRAAAAQARDVTASLRRTRQMMVSELQRGDSTLASLDGQAKTIKDTLQEQKGITSSARSGKAALGRLQRRDCTDKVLIALGAHPVEDVCHLPRRLALGAADYGRPRIVPRHSWRGRAHVTHPGFFFFLLVVLHILLKRAPQLPGLLGGAGAAGADVALNGTCNSSNGTGDDGQGATASAEQAVGAAAADTGVLL